MRASCLGAALLLRCGGAPGGADPRRRHGRAGPRTAARCSRRPARWAGRGLSRAAVAFERLAGGARGGAGAAREKVAELERTNAELADARESLLRSERLATVGRLAAGMAHEVGNPLGAIGGYAALARARLGTAAPADPEVEDFLGADRGGGGADRRASGSCSTSRGRRRPALLPVGLAAALDAALRLARVQPRFRDVEVALDSAADAPARARRRARLGQVFLNLLLNAGDAMGGRGRLRSPGRARVGGGVGRGPVRRPGSGDRPEHLSRVFDPFFTTKPPGEGTGLGLAVCHGILVSFGGASRPPIGEGGGAELSLELRRWTERVAPP